MSESPEELGRRALALLEGDDVEALIELCDPEISFRPVIAGVESGPYEGYEGVRRWFEELSSSFDERRPRIVSIDAHGEDSVVSEVDLHLRGRVSGVEIGMPVFGAGRFRAGRIVWWGFFESRDEALRELDAN